MKKKLFILLSVAFICLTACQEPELRHFNIINIEDSDQIVFDGPVDHTAPQCEIDINDDKKTDIIFYFDYPKSYIKSLSDDVEIALGPKAYTFELGDVIDADEDYWMGKDEKINVPIISPTHYVAIKVHQGTKTYCGWIDHTPVDLTQYGMPCCHKITKVAICTKANTPIYAGKTTLK